MNVVSCAVSTSLLLAAVVVGVWSVVDFPVNEAPWFQLYTAWVAVVILYSAGTLVRRAFRPASCLRGVIHTSAELLVLFVGVALYVLVVADALCVERGGRETVLLYTMERVAANYTIFGTLVVCKVAFHVFESAYMLRQDAAVRRALAKRRRRDERQARQPVLVPDEEMVEVELKDA